MKKIFICILSLILALSMSGCAGKKATDVTGTWYADMYGKVLTLNVSEGGIYNMEMTDEAMIGTWALEDGKLYIDQGTSGEKVFDYDAAAQTLDGEGSLFTRKSIKAFKPGKAVAAAVEDFTGNWIATKVDSSDAALPLDTAKFYMNAAIEGTKVILTIGADKEVKEGEAVFADGILTLTIPAANAQESIYTITMLKNDMLSITTELAAGPATFYLEKIAPAA